MGDPIRAMQAAKTIEVINQNSLISSTQATGQRLYTSLDKLAKGKGSGKMSGLRGKGQGTFIAWDMVDSRMRDTFLKMMRGRGINVAGVSISCIDLPFPGDVLDGSRHTNLKCSVGMPLSAYVRC